jgi:hypothetical protein
MAPLAAEDTSVSIACKVTGFNLWLGTDPGFWRVPPVLRGEFNIHLASGMSMLISRLLRTRPMRLLRKPQGKCGRCMRRVFAPEKRPSVSESTSLSRPIPASTEVGIKHIPSFRGRPWGLRNDNDDVAL